MENLIHLKDELNEEKHRLSKRLEEIEDELNSITMVLEIIKKRESKEDDRQIRLIPNEKSNEYANITFKDATLILFPK